ncbi:MAG: hypothetical protein K9H65_02220 [Bacteroidales bacterium]|nr:hypothetical protein [Bacteroidales bacterium]
MRIGFIGNSTFPARMVSSFQQKGHSVCGIYHSRKTKLTADMEEYSSAESLIAAADLVYIADDDLPLFEISKIAIKETTHLFFESPFILDHEAFRHLFHLANESGSVIRFNEKLLIHPVYASVKSQLEPLFISFRMDSSEECMKYDTLRDVLFDIVSIIWDTGHRNLRKMNFLPLEYNTQRPGTFFFDMDFANGTHVNILFNHLTREARFQTELIQTSKRFFMDFTRSKLSVYDSKEGASEHGFKEFGSEAGLIVEDFRSFVLNLGNANLPLTINEDNEAMLSLTHLLLQEMHHKAQLLI